MERCCCSSALISSLPEALLAQVFSHIKDAKDMQAAVLTCKLWQTVGDGVFWRTARWGQGLAGRLCCADIREREGFKRRCAVVEHLEIEPGLDAHFLAHMLDLVKVVKHLELAVTVACNEGVERMWEVGCTVSCACLCALLASPALRAKSLAVVCAGASEVAKPDAPGPQPAHQYCPRLQPSPTSQQYFRPAYPGQSGGCVPAPAPPAWQGAAADWAPPAHQAEPAASAALCTSRRGVVTGDHQPAGKAADPLLGQLARAQPMFNS